MERQDETAKGRARPVLRCFAEVGGAPGLGEGPSRCELSADWSTGDLVWRELARAPRVSKLASNGQCFFAFALGLNGINLSVWTDLSLLAVGSPALPQL